jgi:hypothetical protein
MRTTLSGRFMAVRAGNYVSGVMGPLGWQLDFGGERRVARVFQILRKASAYFAQAELDRRFKP